MDLHQFSTDSSRSFTLVLSIVDLSIHLVFDISLSCVYSSHRARLSRATRVCLGRQCDSRDFQLVHSRITSLLLPSSTLICSSIPFLFPFLLSFFRFICCSFVHDFTLDLRSMSLIPRVFGVRAARPGGSCRCSWKFGLLSGARHCSKIVSAGFF